MPDSRHQKNWASTAARGHQTQIPQVSTHDERQHNNEAMRTTFIRSINNDVNTIHHPDKRISNTSKPEAWFLLAKTFRGIRKKRL
jgi:hypothetical protein